MRRLACLAMLSLLPAAAPRCLAEGFQDYDWVLHDTAGGGGFYDIYAMTVIGGDAGVYGVTEWLAPACVTSTIYGNLNYTSGDTGPYDYAYYSIDGVIYPIADNDNQGDHYFQFEVPEGKKFGFGVETADGQQGAGTAVVSWGYGTAVALNMASMGWFIYDTAYGTGYADPANAYIHIVGGDAGVGGDTLIFSYSQSPMTMYHWGNYASGDTDLYDYAEWYTDSTGFVPFMYNNGQGPFYIQIDKPAGDSAGIAVGTTDGSFGPGVLDSTDFFAWGYAAHLLDMYWYPQDTAGGTVNFHDTYFLDIYGGDAGVGGITEVIDLDITLDYCVKFWANYQSADEGNYDYAYYSINGVEHLIADNDHQDVYPVTVELKRGDTFSIGVATADGLLGAGHVTIYGYRAFPRPPGGQSCYADCDSTGALDFFDFLCFQNQFAGGDPYADCDGTGGLDFFDFLCFQNEFAGGC